MKRSFFVRALTFPCLVACGTGTSAAKMSDGGVPFKVTQNCLIELHLHLDGSISIASARQLAKMCGETLPESDDALSHLLMCPEGCRDLNDYLSRFDLPCRLMQTPETLEQSAFNLCEELRANGLIYAELRFAPQKHTERGMTQEDAVKAAIRGIARSKLRAQLILCCMRGEGNAAQNLETVELTSKYLGKGVCACDLAGAEALYPNGLYADIFAQARKLNVPFTLHAGEALGAESVDAALSLSASRIGHGVRAAESEQTLALIKEKNIPLEICPTSNLNTCVYENVADMPVAKLLKDGIRVTISSDNMSVSNTNVRRELQAVADSFNFGAEDVKQLLLNAADASFTDSAVKAELRSKIEAEFSK